MREITEPRVVSRSLSGGGTEGEVEGKGTKEGWRQRGGRFKGEGRSGRVRCQGTTSPGVMKSTGL